MRILQTKARQMNSSQKVKSILKDLGADEENGFDFIGEAKKLMDDNFRYKMEKQREELKHNAHAPRKRGKNGVEDDH
jgi:hypothetical protein